MENWHSGNLNSFIITIDIIIQSLAFRSTQLRLDEEFDAVFLIEVIELENT